MPAAASAYLVVRRDDGFGEVFPLTVGQRYTLGRSATNRIVLKDDLCSREHAEVRFADAGWRVRDLGSLNGTRVNDQRIEGERALSPSDEVHLGRSHLVFVEDMDQLPDLPPAPPPSSGSVSIRKRLGQTRFLTPQPPLPDGPDATHSGTARRHSRGSSHRISTRRSTRRSAAARAVPSRRR